MNFSELREMYPEFADISDIDFVEQLHQRYIPEMDGATFAKQIRDNSRFKTFLLGDLYTTRANAFKALGKIGEANKDFARARIMTFD
jgi:hypothetical protein